MEKRLREIERQLTTTVAEQNRRAEVAAELKGPARPRAARCMREDVPHRQGASLVRRRASWMRRERSATNLALYESKKRAKGLVQKLITRDRQAKSTRPAQNEAAEQLSEVSKLYSELLAINAEMKKELHAAQQKAVAAFTEAASGDESEG
eukprot:3657832-Pleurochrysis_carterae.AAC.3